MMSEIVTNLGEGGAMEKVGMGISETNHELIIIEAGCEDIWKLIIIFFITMYIFDISIIKI